MHWLVISKPSWGWDGAASSGATCRQPSHVFQCLLSFSGYFYLDHLTIVRACLGSSTQAWVDFLFLKPQSLKHCYSECGIERQQIGNLLFLTLLTLSWFPCISFYTYIFLNVHTHTDTQIVSLYNVLFWILRKHGPCLSGSPSDAFSHAMELLGSWTSWSPYAKTQGASKAVWVVKRVVMVLESLVTVRYEL